MNTTSILFKKIDGIKKEVQRLLNRKWDCSEVVRKAISELEIGATVDYSLDSSGYCIKAVSFSVGDVAEFERDYFEEYLDQLCVYVDWKNKLLYQNLGNDCIFIQEDDLRNTGVWQDNVRILSPELYNSKDVTMRDTLINDHMESTGYFPHVFKLDRDGNIQPISLRVIQKGGD